MTIKIKSYLCIGFGDCIAICPEVFKRIGSNTVVEQVVMTDKLTKACMKAEIMCPMGAISISEEEALKI